MDKKQALINWFQSHPQGYLLFSGGFDSSAVLGAAMLAGANIIPIWVDNGFNRASAEEMLIQARNLGSDKLEVIDVTPGQTVVENPVKRCYHCKKHILSQVPQDGLPIFDGTTASDLGNYRPGKQALDEYKVLSPLAELGITCSETKELAISFGADPLLSDLESCLATRVNYSHLLTAERISAIRTIENLFVEKVGDFHVRCRIDDADHLRVELSKPESYQAIGDEQFRQQLFDIGSRVSLFVTIDVKRSRPNEYDKRIKKH